MLYCKIKILIFKFVIFYDVCKDIKKNIFIKFKIFIDGDKLCFNEMLLFNFVIIYCF